MALTVTGTTAIVTVSALPPDWPTVADVKAFLRIVDTSEDAMIGSELAAAVTWVSSRVQQQYVPDSTTYVPPLPPPLYAVALHETARLVRRRDSVDGTIGWGDMGIVRVGPKDPDIETMIAPYLNIVFG